MCSNNNIESIIRKEGFYLFTGTGCSMWPLIRDGVDTVEIRPLSGEIQPGDIILFHQEDRYILHRVLAAAGGTITARGDNNIATETVPVEAVVGVMAGLWRGEKKISPTSFRYRTYNALCLKCPRLFRLTRKLFWR